ncbi:MAG: PolC-type DNA polymerase III [Thermotogota bacterium]
MKKNKILSVKNALKYKLTKQNISLYGKIFLIDDDEKKNYTQIFITDNKEAVILKIFEKNLDYKKDDFIKAKGFFEFDNLNGDYSFSVSEHKEYFNFEKKDGSIEKRTELHLHSKFSEQDSIVDIEELLKTLKYWGHTHVAITDHESVQNIPEFWNLSKKYNITPIFGAEITVFEPFLNDFFHVTILAKNKSGLKNLYKIISQSHMNLNEKKPIINIQDIEKNRKDLYIGSACTKNILMYFYLKQDEEMLLKKVKFFDYIEIQPLEAKEDDRITKEKLKKFYLRITEAAENENIPVILTGNVHYIYEKDKEIHNALQKGIETLKKFNKTYNSKRYLRTTEEMIQAGIEIYGKRGKAKKIAVRNVKKLIDTIEKIEPFDNKLHAPKIKDENLKLKDLVYHQTKKIYGEKIHSKIKQRIEKELSPIIKNGYAIIFLLAREMILKSKEDGYPVGARGSVGSSLIAFILGISEVNPLPPHYYCKCGYVDFIDNLNISGFDLERNRCPNCGKDLKSNGHNIRFEIFMGFDGKKIPDIDINFSGEYQTKIHRYLEEKFGREHCFKAGTINTIAKRSALKFSEKYLKKEGHIAKIFYYAEKLKGVKMTTGQHTSAMIIIPQENNINDFTPYQYSANDKEKGILTTHFDYEALENDLLKIDALAHDAPTFLKKLKDLTGIGYEKLPMNDKDVLELFSSLKPLKINLDEIDVEIGTLGIPEVWTPFAHRMLSETKPKSFYDLARTSSLSHGTNIWFNNARELVLKKQVSVNQVVSCRDDILLTLEHYGIESKKAFNIMEKVRKGKKLTEEELKLLISKNVPKWYIKSLIKIKYLFPRSHAVAYMYMAYKIAFYKLYYRLEFYSVYFSVRAKIFDIDTIFNEELMMKKIEELSDVTYKHDFENFLTYSVLRTAYEMKKQGYYFLPPDIYKSHITDFVIEGKNLRIPLTKIPNVGIKGAVNIFKEREKKFISIEDFKKRTKISKRIIEKLKTKDFFKNLPEKSQIPLF